MVVEKGGCGWCLGGRGVQRGGGGGENRVSLT